MKTLRKPITLAKLPPRLRDEVIEYMMEGNDHRDTMVQLLEKFSHEEMVQVLGEIREFYMACGDYPEIETVKWR